jgi:hypothetical protein
MNFPSRGNIPYISVVGITNDKMDDYMFENLRKFWEAGYGKPDEVSIEIINHGDWTPLVVAFTDLRKNETLQFTLVSEINGRGLQGFYIYPVPAERSGPDPSTCLHKVISGGLLEDKGDTFYYCVSCNTTVSGTNLLKDRLYELDIDHNVWVHVPKRR